MEKRLSWSELNLWETDRPAWTRKYLLGQVDPTTRQQARGKHIHAYCFQQPECQSGDYNAEDMKLYTVGEIRVHDVIRAFFFTHFPHELFTWETKHEPVIEGVETLGYWDGYDKDGKVIVELKSGASQWTEKQAADHGQLCFYAAQHKALYGTIPPVLLASVSTKNGKMVVYEVTLTEEQVALMEQRIKRAKEDMGSLWAKRMITNIN